MDNYTIDEVKKIIQANLLTKEVLNSIIESSIRRIEIFGDKDSIEILEFLKSNQMTPLEVKNDIEKFLDNYRNDFSSIFDSHYYEESKSYLFYIIIGIMFILLGIILLF